MNQTIKHWIGGAALAAFLITASHIAAGPSDLQAAEAQAASLADAQAQAQHVATLARECYRLRGPSAVLLQIRDTDNFVCREGAIEPTPAEVLHRYALLGSQQ